MDQSVCNQLATAVGALEVTRVVFRQVHYQTFPR